MNDVKMMLGKRAAQYYLFTTWCITAPVLMLVSGTSGGKHRMGAKRFLFIEVISLSNLLGAKRMFNGAGAGYQAYEYPPWSSVLGWCIFACCVMPIPLVYFINYIQEYRSLSSRSMLKFRSEERPRFLEAIRQNHSPRLDWGPKRKANHVGIYAHLSSVDDDRGKSMEGWDNGAFHRDSEKRVFRF